MEQLQQSLDQQFFLLMHQEITTGNLTDYLERLRRLLLIDESMFDEWLLQHGHSTIPMPDGSTSTISQSVTRLMRNLIKKNFSLVFDNELKLANDSLVSTTYTHPLISFLAMSDSELYRFCIEERILSRTSKTQLSKLCEPIKCAV